MNHSGDLEIIAEIHPQHGGDKGMIREMIRQAKIGGADIVKVQLYDSRKFEGPDLDYLSLTREDLHQIQRWCDQECIELSASVFDRERLEWCLEMGMKHLKVASISLKREKDLCDEIVDRAEKLTVSLGHWAGADLPYPPSERLRYLYCKSKYPAFAEDMDDFPERFEAGHVAGYSDHTLGLGFCLLAVARGASIIEKHMTLNKQQKKIFEKAHICSMTGEELNELRRVGGELHRLRRLLP